MVLILAGCIAAWWHHWRGYTLYYGDANAHLAIARRILDSRTPGTFQIGTVWLPLPHLLMLPFVTVEAWWRSGLAGAIPSAACFVTGGLFLFAAVRRLFSPAAAWASMLAFALNPNLLYLQSAPMTEAPFAACLMALLYATVWFQQKGGVAALLLAAAASNAASLTRYEGWFLIPFVALFFLRSGGVKWGLAFGGLAAAAPLSWLAHNMWYYSNPLEFYNGPYSAKAYYAQGLAAGVPRAPGDHDWQQAMIQFAAAARLCAGFVLAIAGLAGAAVAVWKRAWWPVALLLLPGLFYVLSLYSSGTPIYVPHLWPHSYYNTRYGLAAIPLFAVGIGALVAATPPRWSRWAATLLVCAVTAQWILYPRAGNWVCWRESEVNSVARRAWTQEAAVFLKAHYRPGDGVFSGFGDQVGVYREAGIALRDVLHEGNHPAWNAAVARPDLFLRERWALALKGDAISAALKKKQLRGTHYECVKIVSLPDSPVIEIYRRIHEDSVYQGSRRKE